MKCEMNDVRNIRANKEKQEAGLGPSQTLSL